MDFPRVVIIFGKDLTNVGPMRSITILWQKRKKNMNMSSIIEQSLFSFAFYFLNRSDVSVLSSKAPKFDILNVAFVCESYLSIINVAFA